ncbi:DNA-binding transcriptional regulator, LysR family [Loktanella sp. DSM 29012]|uniref:LysR family transcriptional regulator n=1 Tax=Loktanella gaetbuli TaxID=2881335 RepID=A0ABS8BWC2_9RHOB|nr:MULTISPECIES: LysR family transcriptional regulator [Loktanella]MCB5200012.1 LysR family transcriptional regulator [Loktanella gaetbuli]SEQ41022.1 DNA-binding transcriptional regulator, LysR family [Loktanella sp. DSM 29012]
MDSWDEIRTAFQVARAGTVSGAAEQLGVHHATVIRHIDSLEGRLGVKLFQRHARGYTPTDAGVDLLRVAQTTDEQFTQLVGRIKGQGDGVSGELIITSIGELSIILAGVIHEFNTAYPEIRSQILTDERIFRLEYGEAHVAVRAGARPAEPDNVVQPLMQLRPVLVASEDYLARMGPVESEADLARHEFVTHMDGVNRAPFYRWLSERVPDERRRIQTTDARVLREAILAGAGIGFMSRLDLLSYPKLVPVIESPEEWSVDVWIVTHVDLHRSKKVQTFVAFLKDWVKKAEL